MKLGYSRPKRQYWKITVNKIINAFYPNVRVYFKKDGVADMLTPVLIVPDNYPIPLTVVINGIESLFAEMDIPTTFQIPLTD